MSLQDNFHMIIKNIFDTDLRSVTSISLWTCKLGPKRSVMKVKASSNYKLTTNIITHKLGWMTIEMYNRKMIDSLLDLIRTKIKSHSRWWESGLGFPIWVDCAHELKQTLDDERWLPNTSWQSTCVSHLC